MAPRWLFALAAVPHISSMFVHDVSTPLTISKFGSASLPPHRFASRKNLEAFLSQSLA